MCPRSHGIYWFWQDQSHHLRIRCPRGNRRMAPPQAFLYRLCCLLLWPVQYIVCTWRWVWASWCQRCHWFYCKPVLSNLHVEWSLCRDLKDTWSSGFCQSTWSTSSPKSHIRTLGLPVLTVVLFHPCQTKRDSASLAFSRTILRWWPGHLHTCLPRCVLELMGGGFQYLMNTKKVGHEPWWTHTELFFPVAIVHALHEMHEPLLDAKLAINTPDSSG